MYHPYRNIFGAGMFDKLPSGAMGNLTGTQNQHVRMAELFFDAPLLPVKHFQGHSK
jgi:hypothetical protein